jgi:hypothetical protein
MAELGANVPSGAMAHCLAHRCHTWELSNGGAVTGVVSLREGYPYIFCREREGREDVPQPALQAVYAPATALEGCLPLSMQAPLPNL